MLRLAFNGLSRANSRASQLGRGSFLSNYFHRPKSEMSKTKDPHSFTVSFLQKTCGLSKESAISASNKVFIETPEKADSVLNLMRTHGLNQTHIAKIIENRPGLLLVDLEDRVRPNLELLKSLGISGSSLAKMLSTETRFLENDLLQTVEFFRAYSFGDEQITMMLKKLPGLFNFKVDTNLKPKMEYFKSLGFPDEDIAKILSWEPYILERSLEKQIIPSIQVLRRVLGTDLEMLKAIKACYYILEYNLEDTLERNILALKSHGVPESLILRIFMIQPRTLLLRHYRFEEVLKEVVKFGFNPNSILFVLAVRSIATMSKTLWKQKLECYRSFGLSTDQVYSAFKLQPMFMLVSEKKIKKSMDFFTRKLKLEPSIISRHPGLLLFSLEKRIIPRSSVLQLLMSKGFVKQDTSIIPYIRMTEKNFMKNIVSVYREKLPDVVKAHEGKIEFQGFPVNANDVI